MRAVDFAHNIGAMHWVLLVALSASHDAGHNCCVAAYHRGERCYVIDTANGTAALSGLTPTVTIKNHRVYHLLRYMNTARVLDGLADDRIAFYLSDTIDACMWSTTAFVHTYTQPSDPTALLYPTPYMLRDIVSGRLGDYIKKHCGTVEPFAVFTRRRPRLMFRGTARTSERKALAILAHAHPAWLDIKLIFMKGHSRGGVPPGVAITRLTPEAHKMEYQFLLHVKAGSSQWNIYTDFLMGGLVFRHKSDPREEWAAPLWHSREHVETYGAQGELVERVVRLANDTAGVYTRAMSAKIIACERLAPERIAARFSSALRIHHLRTHP